MSKNYANLITENAEYLKAWAQEKNDADLYKDKIKLADYYWWKCPNGHYRRRQLYYFLKKPNYCPDCERIKNSVGSNPDIMRFWDFEKNANIDPFYHYEYEPIDIYWKCKKCGYEWTSKLKGSGERGCPCCEAGVAIQPGYNDAFTKVPLLKEEFIPSENPGIDMTKLGPGNDKVKINWTCRVCGHKWPATIFSRTKGQNGKNKINKCPRCGRRKRDIPYSEEYPDLDKKWIKELNGMSMDNLLDQDKKHWWMCEIHGPFKQSFIVMKRARNTKFKGCPHCRKENSLLEYQTLYYQYKELIQKEWAPENRYLADPKKISPKNVTRVLWICNDCKEKYPMSIKKRTLYYKRGRTACPYCKNRSINKGHIVL